MKHHQNVTKIVAYHLQRTVEISLVSLTGKSQKKLICPSTFPLTIHCTGKKSLSLLKLFSFHGSIPKVSTNCSPWSNIKYKSILFPNLPFLEASTWSSILTSSNRFKLLDLGQFRNSIGYWLSKLPSVCSLFRFIYSHLLSTATHCAK